MPSQAEKPMNRRFAPTRPELIHAALFAVVAGLLYVLFHLKGNTTAVDVYSASAFRWMVFFWGYTQGYGGAAYSQGWIIPLVSLWIVWMRRRELASAPKRVRLAGLAVVALALLLHWIGAKSQQTRLSLFAFVLLTWGIPFYLYGWAVARRLILPCAFLIFCIPLNFFDSVWFPLRILSARAGALLLAGLGVDAGSSGSLVFLAGPERFSFETADAACSIRMVLAVAAFAAVVAGLGQQSLFKQWLLFATCVPAAMLANTARTIIVAMAAEGFGSKAGLFLYAHFSSALTYGVAFAFVWGAGIVMRKLSVNRTQAWTPQPTAP